MLDIPVFDENSVQVSIYSSSRCNPVAVIKGIDCNFEKLLLDTRYLRIYHGEAATNCVIKPVSIFVKNLSLHLVQKLDDN